jgi:hypothetical protein
LGRPSIGPAIKAHYRSAIINGIAAVPIMIVMMLMTAKSEIMSKLVVKGRLRGFVWPSTAIMAGCLWHGPRVTGAS